jgi:hypothetical protein
MLMKLKIYKISTLGVNVEVSNINKRAQSGVEYMAVVGIALLVLTSGTIILSNYSKSINDQVITNQINIIGNTIINNAESMYVLGNESWVTIEFNFPTAIKSADIYDNTDLVFSYYTSSGVSNIVFFMDKFNLSNDHSTPCTSPCELNITPGVNRLKIRSGGSYVSLLKVP